MTTTEKNKKRSLWTMFAAALLIAAGSLMLTACPNKPGTDENTDSTAIEDELTDVEVTETPETTENDQNAEKDKKNNKKNNKKNTKKNDKSNNNKEVTEDNDKVEVKVVSDEELERRRLEAERLKEEQVMKDFRSIITSWKNGKNSKQRANQFCTGELGLRTGSDPYRTLENHFKSLNLNKKTEMVNNMRVFKYTGDKD